MSKINGIYAAGMSIFNKDLSLNIEKTILHAENIIDKGCHGVAIFGSTGQAQLISISEKIKLLNNLSKSKYKNKFIIGNGLNSLSETINYIKIALSLNFENFLISKFNSFFLPECENFASQITNLSTYWFSIFSLKSMINSSS